MRTSSSLRIGMARTCAWERRLAGGLVCGCLVRGFRRILFGSCWFCPGVSGVFWRGDDREEMDISYVVLLTELLAERGAHDGAAHAGRSTEVRLARLSPGGGEGCCKSAFPLYFRTNPPASLTCVDLGHRVGLGVVSWGARIDVVRFTNFDVQRWLGRILAVVCQDMHLGKLRPSTSRLSGKSRPVRRSVSRCWKAYRARLAYLRQLEHSPLAMRFLGQWKPAQPPGPRFACHARQTHTYLE